MTTIEQLANETLAKYGFKEPPPKLLERVVARMQTLIENNVPTMVPNALSSKFLERQ